MTPPAPHPAPTTSSPLHHPQPPSLYHPASDAAHSSLHDGPPTSLSPPLAAGALAAATGINNAAYLPSPQHLQWLLGCALALAFAAIVSNGLARWHLSRRRNCYPPVANRNRPSRYSRYPSQWLMRFCAFTLSAWFLLTIASKDAREWLDSTVAAACEGQALTLAVEIDDMPTLVDGQGRATARMLPGQSAHCGRLPGRISIGWSAPNDKTPETQTVDWQPQAGERWRIALTLRRPVATLNFDGFDVHHYWLRESIGALGRLTPPPRAPLPERIGTSTTQHMAGWRHELAKRISIALPQHEYPHQSILLGLAIGLQKSIAPAQWDVLSATGTSHLVSISGMHVTLLAGWLAWLVLRIWPRIPALSLKLSARHAAALFSLPVAALYAGLAGWGIPAQRTIAMLTIATALLLLQQRTRPLDLLCLSATLIAVSSPWSATSAGFLLSFGAVGILIFSGAGRTRHTAPRLARLRKLTSEHMTVFIGLMPLSVALFGQFSWISPVANLLAVSWMGLVTTPLILVACLLNFAWLMQLAHASLTPIWLALDFLAQFSLAWQPVSPPPLSITLLSIAGGLMALMPAGFMLRTPGLLLIALPFFWPVDRPQTGEFEVSVLDIGQGNSIAVRTANHTMLVDAGNATSMRQDQGRSTVMPWLHHRGQRHWDAVLVSHNDSDHAGGMHSVLRASRTETLYANPPFQPPPVHQARIAQHMPCIAGTRWTWDGITFDILYPAATDLSTETEDNALSCVLRISGPGGSALLPGDIGVEQENTIIDRLGTFVLKSDLVLVPHHGSETSSSVEFIQAVRPRWAVFQVGYRNRYQHPKPDIASAWQKAGALNLRTDQTGALRFRFREAGVQWQSARRERARFWHLQPVDQTQDKRVHHSGATRQRESLSE